VPPLSAFPIPPAYHRRNSDGCVVTKMGLGFGLWLGYDRSWLILRPPAEWLAGAKEASGIAERMQAPWHPPPATASSYSDGRLADADFEHCDAR
jgi:hypothetical protein